MQGDFSNITYDHTKHYSTVFELQGRVGLDANRNEQTASLLHYLRAFAADLIGQHGGPPGAFDVEVETDNNGQPHDLTITAGHYYVNGIMCENEFDATKYGSQPDAFINLKSEEDALPADPYIAYLKVWERHVTEIEAPHSHEVALGMLAPDCASRAQVVWQLRLRAFDGNSPEAAWKLWSAAWTDLEHRGRLRVRAVREQSTSTDPCNVAPSASYVGENQLYRVQVHSGGTAAGGATFTWSRDNGSVIYPIESVTGNELILTTLGRDWLSFLEVGSMVEVVDDAHSLRRELGEQEPSPPLRRVVDLDVQERRVVLDVTPPNGTGSTPANHPYLRRWDQPLPGESNDRAIPIREDEWIDLEAGIQIRFDSAPTIEDDETPSHYRVGDYWTFAARRATGDVIWPTNGGNPVPQAPHGVQYSYAPLASIDGANATPLRKEFQALAK